VIDPGDDRPRRCLALLGDAADAADELGLSTVAARETLAVLSERLGFPADAYVLALVGGTGVGKSSLLNALAGTTVSPASVRRPTTSEAVAWVPAADRAALEPLLAWLDVRDVREHAGELGTIAILDLPDMDSVASTHRERVEAILPRVDAVAWVTDLEKYADAALHDGFLRAWAPRLERQAVIVNKADRLAGDERDRLRRDLADDLARDLPRPSAAPIPVLMTIASVDAGPDLHELRAWLEDGAAAKAVVRSRVAATVTDRAAALGRDAGIDVGDGEAPFFDPAARAAAVDGVTREVLRAVDLEGLQRQAIAATRARARARGAGPMGRITSFLYRVSGRATRVADPTLFLRRWRDRASLTTAVESMRLALARPIADASPSLRPRLAAVVEPVDLRRGLERAVDRSISSLDALDAPSSRWWSLIGLVQTVATLAIALAAAWVVVWILVRPPAASLDLPVIGLVPMPFAVLVATVLVGYLLARILGLHAGWIGRRWARRVRDRVAASVRQEITDHGFESLDRLEAARRSLRTSLVAIDHDCGRRG
jgi:GTP-binding protein EngB required for normal cell division